MTPPTAYALWWQLAEACSGVTGDLAAVRWFELPGASQFTVRDTAYQSYWWAVGNRIVVVANKKLDGQLIRHEMLHSLTGPHHLTQYFRDKCGGYVACEGNCAKEAGSIESPASTAATVEPTALAVSVAVAPQAASIRTYGGWVAIEVTATAQTDSAIWVALTPVGTQSGAAATFGYFFDCAYTGCSGASEYDYIFGTRMGFQPRQVRRYVFDRQLSEGQYSIHGFFNRDTTESRNVTITP